MSIVWRKCLHISLVIFFFNNGVRVPVAGDDLPMLMTSDVLIMK